MNNKVPFNRKTLTTMGVPLDLIDDLLELFEESYNITATKIIKIMEQDAGGNNEEN